MTKSSSKNVDYALRIANATPNELNIITFELCILNIEEALENIDSNPKLFSRKINTALCILKEIIVSLNFDYDISIELSKIYLYINRLLIHSKFNFDKNNLIDSIELLTTIKEGFEQIDEGVSTAKVMTNTQKVFAGLTYGRNGNLTEYIDNSSSTGFQA